MTNSLAETDVAIPREDGFTPDFFREKFSATEKGAVFCRGFMLTSVT
jgi:hypothetical protein